MICPHCNSTMNRHAEKPVDPTTREEEQRVAEGGMVIEEAHRCPKCGFEAARRVMLSYA
jgi:ribosomal protein L37AE/L43A